MFKSRLGLFVFLALFAGTAAAGDTGRCSMPMKLQRGIPFVRVMLNGRGPFTFAVDTGTSREAIVSPAVVKSLHLPVVDRTWLLDLPGKKRLAVDVVAVDSLSLPGHVSHSVRAMVHEPLATLERYDGVLGFAFFRDTVVTLDFPQRCLRLDGTGLESGADPDVVPFSMPRNVPVIELTIGKQKVLAQIDSAGGGINLPGSAAPAIEFQRDTEVLVRADSQLSTFFLHGGVMKGDLFLGGQVFMKPFVEISSLIPVGNLGAAALQDFAVTFDQKQRLVRFHAKKKAHRVESRQLAPDNAVARNTGKTPVFVTGGN